MTTSEIYDFLKQYIDRKISDLNTSLQTLFTTYKTKEVGDNINAIKTVADNIPDINTVVNDEANIDTVATNIDSVNTVAANIQSVTGASTYSKATIDANDANALAFAIALG